MKKSDSNDAKVLRDHYYHAVRNLPELAALAEDFRGVHWLTRNNVPYGKLLLREKNGRKMVVYRSGARVGVQVAVVDESGKSLVFCAE